MTAWVLGGDDGAAILVTQTDDVEQAKRIALADPTVVRDAAELWEDLTYEQQHNEQSREQRAASWLDQAQVRIEHGRFICSAWALYEGYRQVWRGFDASEHERVTGETTAVRFIAPPYEGPVG